METVADTPLANWIWYISYLSVLFILGGYGFHRLTIIYLYLKHSKERPEPTKHFDELPLVTIQLPIFNEKDVVNRLFKAVKELDYPQDKIQIQVLDDSTDDTVDISRAGVALLVADGFDAELIHRTDRTGYKAGALENATESAKGEFLMILDADFVPKKNMLQKIIHYFADEKIGMVQTRWGHLNRNYNMLTRVQAMFLDGHLELEQTARNRSGRFFTFNGTAGVWRKSTIADAGGWDHDTLTEDMDLSYRAQLNGWKFIFLNDVETPAELPVDMNGFKSQQHRWTKGSIQVCRKILMEIWRSDAPMVAKMEATAHLTSNFAYLCLIVLCFLIYPNQTAQPEMDTVTFYLINIPIFFFSSVSIYLFYLMSQKALRPYTWWKEVLYLPFALAVGVGMSINNAKAVLEALMGHQSEFVRTPKYGISSNADTVLKGEVEESAKSKKPSYKAMKAIVIPIIEFLFGCFFLYIVVGNLMRGQIVSSVLLLTFPVGFFYTAISSLMQNCNLCQPKAQGARK